MHVRSISGSRQSRRPYDVLDCDCCLETLLVLHERGAITRRAIILTNTRRIRRWVDSGRTLTAHNLCCEDWWVADHCAALYSAGLVVNRAKARRGVPSSYQLTDSGKKLVERLYDIGASHLQRAQTGN